MSRNPLNGDSGAPRRSGPAQAPPAEPEPQLADVDDRWRLRPNRILIGLGLVVIGLVWSILNGTLGPSRGTGPPVPVVHGPVATRVQTLDGMRVRPELAPNVTARQPARVIISFHNDSAATRRVTPTDVRLDVAGHSLAPLSAHAGAVQPTALRPGAFVTGTLYFARPLAPGATLTYTPSWAPGHTLRWQLWH